MEIYVKRRTLYLGWLGSLELKFNGERIRSIQGKTTHNYSIPESKDILSYLSLFDRSRKINIKDGDTIVIKETILSKMINILFLTTILGFLVFNFYSFATGVYLDHPFIRYTLITLSISLTVIFVISLFFQNYKFIIENEK